MITCEQLADLREGDFVELFVAEESLTVRGPVMSTGPRGFMVGGWPIKQRSPSDTVTVISAPRPLYVNHPRTEPVPGDVVRDADMETRTRVWSHLPHVAFLGEPWVTQSGNEPIRLRRSELPARLRLLVDGKTGQVVP